MATTLMESTGNFYDTLMGQATQGRGRMVLRLKLMADYGQTVLWNADSVNTGPVDPDTLPLSEGLKAAIHAWAVTYDATLDQDDPRRSGFSGVDEQAAFESEGIRLWRQMQTELGPRWTISYFSEIDGILHGSPGHHSGEVGTD